MIAGCSIEALDAAEALGEREDLAALEETPRARESVAQLEGDHAAEAAAHLAPRQRVLRMRFAAPGRRTRATFGLALEPARQFERVVAVPLHAHASVLMPRRTQEAVERTGDRTDRVLQERQALAQLRGASSLLTTATPPITSEWPFRYFVVECTTTSKPSSSGRWKYGLMKVLSAHAQEPRRGMARRAIAARSASLSIGLVGVSTQTQLASSGASPPPASPGRRGRRR